MAPSRKIAMVGCAPTWKKAPYDDQSWAIWAHTSCQALNLPRVDVWFDIHDVGTWRQGKVWFKGEGTYVEWLASRPQTVMMQQRYALIPKSEAYPLAAIVDHFGIVPTEWNLTPSEPRWWQHVKNRGEFTSTFTYMMALALYEGVDEIALYGIDFIGFDAGDIERTYQRPGAKYWVGIARGQGVPVTVAPGSWLEFSDRLYGYPVLPALQEVSA